MPCGEVVVLSHDIELEVTPRDRAGEYEVRVVRAACGGEPRASLRLDVARMLGMRGSLESTVLASAAHARSGRVPEAERPLRDAGQELFEGLFTGAVRETYRSCVALARDHGTRLRVVLHLEAPELAALPWEAMWDPQEQAYLCRKEPLVRHVPAPYTPDPLPITPPLRILGLVASPRGLPALDVERERGHLVQAVERAVADGRIHLDWLEDGTWDALQDHLLNSTCHVLHFIGHGDYDPDLDQGRVALVREDDGRADWVEAGRLIDLLNQADPTPQLVVLNSCSSGQAGTQDPLSGTASVLVHGGVSAVAAMQFRISDPAAVAFPRGFYKALAAGKSVEAALSSGRIAILGRGESLEWVTPVLYMRGGATQLFTIAAPTPPPQQAGTPTPGDSQAPDPVALAGAERQPDPDLSTAAGGLEADPDWNDALEAYFTEQWAAARDLLTGILARHPGDAGVSDKLSRAQLQVDLARWYAQAQHTAAAGEWDEAAAALDHIVAADAGYRDAGTLLERARWQQRRASLINDIRRLHSAGRWQAVLAAGTELVDLDPDTVDPDSMISHARQTLADFEVANLYAQGLRQLDNGDQVAALATFTRIQQERPDYRGTLTLLAQLTHQQASDQQTEAIHEYKGGTDHRAGEHADEATQHWVRHLLVGQEVLSVAFSPDGTRLATGSRRRVRVWDLHTEDLAWEKKTGGLFDDVAAVAFSPDGTQLATGCWDFTARIWDAANGRELAQVRHGSPVNAVAFSPDGTRLATASDDRTARVWDIGTGTELIRVHHDGAVSAVAFSPDGTWLATASGDKTARVWDIGTGTELAQVRHDDWVRAVAFSPDGTWLVTASDDKTARVWDTGAGTELAKFDDWVLGRAVAFSSDGTRLATAREDKSVRIWDVPGPARTAPG